MDHVDFEFIESAPIYYPAKRAPLSLTLKEKQMLYKAHVNDGDRDFARLAEHTFYTFRPTPGIEICNTLYDYYRKQRQAKDRLRSRLHAFSYGWRYERLNRDDLPIIQKRNEGMTRTLRALGKPDKYPGQATLTGLLDIYFAASQRARGKLYHEHYKIWSKLNTFTDRWLPIRWSTPLQAIPGHYVHVSEDDPTKVAYTRDFDGFMNDRQIRTTPGRYLRKYYPELTEDQVRECAEAYLAREASRRAPVVVVDNNDPKWVGETFQLKKLWRHLYDTIMVDYSCMRGCDSVMAYGVPGNNLAMVTWLPRGATLDDEVGYGRAIVRTDTKQYIRAYPAQQWDDSVHTSSQVKQLEALGYTEGPLEGVRLWRIEGDNSGTLMVPYLDGQAVRVSEDGDDYLRVSDAGDYDAQNASGILDISDGNGCTCSDCGGRYDEDNMHSVDDDLICDGCIDRNYVWSEPADRYLRNDDDAIYVESTDEYYPRYSLREYDIHKVTVGSGRHRHNYYHVADLVFLGYRDAWAHEDDVTILDVETSAGDAYALDEDTVTTEDGKAIWEDEAVETVGGHTYHQDCEELLQFLSPNGGRVMNVHTNDFDPTAFHIVGDKVFWSPGRAERGAMTLVEFIKAGGTITRNLGFQNPRAWKWAMDTWLEEHAQDDEEETSEIERSTEYLLAA